MICAKCGAEFHPEQAVPGGGVTCPSCGLSYRSIVNSETGEITYRPSRRQLSGAADEGGRPSQQRAVLPGTGGQAEEAYPRKEPEARRSAQRLEPDESPDEMTKVYNAPRPMNRNTLERERQVQASSGQAQPLPVENRKGNLPDASSNARALNVQGDARQAGVQPENVRGDGRQIERRGAEGGMPAMPQFKSNGGANSALVNRVGENAIQPPQFIPSGQPVAPARSGHFVSMEPHPLTFIPAGKSRGTGSVDMAEISQKASKLISTGVGQLRGAAGKLKGKAQELITKSKKTD